jgi:hypothetical protein
MEGMAVTVVYWNPVRVVRMVHMAGMVEQQERMVVMVTT